MRNKTSEMTVKDVGTGELFRLDPTENTKRLKTRDGCRATVHPASLRVLVRPGQKFDAHTLTGTREFVRVD